MSEELPSEDASGTQPGPPDGGNGVDGTMAPDGSGDPGASVGTPQQWDAFSQAMMAPRRPPGAPSWVTISDDPSARASIQQGREVIIPGHELKEDHPIVGAKLREMRERSQAIAAEIMARGRPPADPPAPDEVPLRRVLATRIAEHRGLQDALAVAQTSLGRAVDLERKARAWRDQLAAVEKTHTAEFALKVREMIAGGAADAGIDDSSELNAARLRLREATDWLGACTEAREHFETQAADAKRDAEAAAVAVNLAARALLSLEARRVADRVEALEREAAATWAELDALAKAHLPTRPGSPGAVIVFDAVSIRVASAPRGRADMAPPYRLAHEVALSAWWGKYFSALMLNPSAQLADVEMPAVAPQPPLKLPRPKGAV